MVTVALALLALQTSPEPDLKAGAVVTLSTLTARLRDPGGPEVFIAPELKNEALFLKGEFGAPTRLRALVARATCAEWSSDGRSLWLERNVVLKRRLLAEERATLAADLRASFPQESAPAPMSEAEADQATLELQRTSWNAGRSEWSPEAVAKRYRLIQASRPDLRFGLQALDALDPDKLAAALAEDPGTEPIRFLGRGGEGYVPLPFNGPALLAAYRADLAARGGGKPSQGDSAIQRAAAGNRTVEIGLILRRSAFRPMTLSIAAVTPEGRATILGTAEWFWNLPRPQEPLWPGERANDPTPVKLPATEADDMDEREPLNRSAGPILRAISADEARPIVVDLPDGTAFIGRPPNATLSELSRPLRYHVTAEVHDGVIVGRPRLPLTTSASRFPRAELARWRAVAKNAEATLDDAAAVVARLARVQAGSDLETSLGQPFGGRNHPLNSDQRAMLRIWGALPLRTRRALDAGATFASRDLPPVVRTAMYRFLLSATAYGYEDGPYFFDRRGTLPPLELSWRLEAPYTSFAVATDGPHAGSAFDLELLTAILPPQLQGRQIGGRHYEDLSRVRFRSGGSQTRYATVRYGADARNSSEGVLKEIRFDSGPPVAWDGLPPALLKPLREAIEWYRNNPG